MQLVLHALRLEGIKPGEEEWGFECFLKLRVVEGDPRRGLSEASAVLAQLERPCVASAELKAQETGLEERFRTFPEPATLLLNEAQAGNGDLWVCALACDCPWRVFSAVIEPLAGAAWPLHEVFAAQVRGEVQRHPLLPINARRCGEGPALVAQWKTGQRSMHTEMFYVHRGENLLEESLVVELEVCSPASGYILASGFSEEAYGPHPVFSSPLALDFYDEADVELRCKVKSAGSFYDEVIAELAAPLPRSSWHPRPLYQRLALRPVERCDPGATITLAFGSEPLMPLTVTIPAAEGVRPKEDAWSFDPFVVVSLYSDDPTSAASAALITEVSTETKNNTFGDPTWEEPVTLMLLNEAGCFLHFGVRAERGYLGHEDSLAECAVPLEEALQFGTMPRPKRYSLRLVDASAKHIHQEPGLQIRFKDNGFFGRLGGTYKPVPSPAAPAERGAGAGPFDIGGGLAGDSGVCNSGDIPDLFAVLGSHGHGVPPALRPPPRPADPSSTGGTCGDLESREHPDVVMERRKLATIAKERGGSIVGVVPLSYLRSPMNPHAGWLPHAVQPR